MKTILDVQKRARTYFDRNWRAWAACRFEGGTLSAELAVNLHPPRESDLQGTERINRARDWASSWRSCALPGVEWQHRNWPSVGDQDIPVRVVLRGAEHIALWAQRTALWETALRRVGDIRGRIGGEWSEFCRDSTWRTRDSQELQRTLLSPVSTVVKADIQAWCDLDDRDWQIALSVWSWLLAHPRQRCYVRQLPIRGIDTKWMESRKRALRGLYQAFSSHELDFLQPGKQFLCKACCSTTQLGGCSEFSLAAGQLDRAPLRPSTVVICENLVNTLCLDGLPDTLAVHGSGYAVSELKAVEWLAETPVLYWGDLDSNGFSILNHLRGFAPHAQSIMMDVHTLNRYFDLCVEEPKPAIGSFERLTPNERNALLALSEGDPARGIENLRLEQERIEWNWAVEQIEERVAEATKEG